MHAPTSMSRTVPTRAAMAAKTNNAEVLSIATFVKFHEHLFPIVKYIVQQNPYRDHTFVQEWEKITTTANIGTNRITAASSFQTVAKALQVSPSSLGACIGFLKTCPTINQYITIQPSSSGSTSFLYQFLAKFLDKIPTAESSTAQKKNGNIDIIPHDNGKLESQDTAQTDRGSAGDMLINDLSLITGKTFALLDCWAVELISNKLAMQLPTGKREIMLDSTSKNKTFIILKLLIYLTTN